MVQVTLSCRREGTRAKRTAANGVSDRSSGTRELGRPDGRTPDSPAPPLSPPLLARPGRAWDGSMAHGRLMMALYLPAYLYLPGGLLVALLPQHERRPPAAGQHSPKSPARVGKLDQPGEKNGSPSLHIGTHIDRHISRETHMPGLAGRARAPRQDEALRLEA